MNSIADALQRFSFPEHLDGFISPSKGIRVEATKQTTLERLPPILIIHLKRFDFTREGGAMKISKNISFDSILSIGKG